jgi:hypothetical protein
MLVLLLLAACAVGEYESRAIAVVKGHTNDLFVTGELADVPNGKLFDAAGFRWSAGEPRMYRSGSTRVWVYAKKRGQCCRWEVTFSVNGKVWISEGDIQHRIVGQNSADELAKVRARLYAAWRKREGT